MAENKLTLKITLKHYDRGFFLCPLCPYDDIRYKTEYCPQCGVKLEWDEDLDKVFVKRRNIEYGNSSINILFPSKEV